MKIRHGGLEGRIKSAIAGATLLVGTAISSIPSASCNNNRVLEGDIPGLPAENVEFGRLEDVYEEDLYDKETGQVKPLYITLGPDPKRGGTAFYESLESIDEENGRAPPMNAVLQRRVTDNGTIETKLEITDNNNPFRDGEHWTLRIEGYGTSAEGRKVNYTETITINYKEGRSPKNLGDEIDDLDDRVDDIEDRLDNLNGNNNYNTNDNDNHSNENFNFNYNSNDNDGNNNINYNTNDNSGNVNDNSGNENSNLNGNGNDNFGNGNDNLPQPPENNNDNFGNENNNGNENGNFNENDNEPEPPLNELERLVEWTCSIPRSSGIDTSFYLVKLNQNNEFSAAQIPSVAHGRVHMTTETDVRENYVVAVAGNEWSEIDKFGETYRTYEGYRNPEICDSVFVLDPHGDDLPNQSEVTVEGTKTDGRYERYYEIIKVVD